MTGFEKGHHGKAKLNKQIGKAIKDAMKATDDPDGSLPAPPGEFIETYQKFLPG